MNAVPPPIAPPPIHPPGSIANSLPWAIVATVLATCLCCPLGLLGVVAIVYASKVTTLLNRGDLDGARQAAATAKIWCWVTTALAIIGLICNILFFALGGNEAYMEFVRQYQRPAP